MSCGLYVCMQSKTGATTLLSLKTRSMEKGPVRRWGGDGDGVTRVREHVWYIPKEVLCIKLCTNTFAGVLVLDHCFGTKESKV